jgi:2'-5' RNA ligase
MANLHRVFIGINLPEKIRKELNAYQDKWLDLPARWTWPESLHVTLVFLGNTSDQEVIDVCKTAAEVAKRHDPFDLVLDKICYGPPDKMPRMVWATGRESGELGALQADLTNAFYESGINEADEDCDNHAFAPHVTLARIKQFELRKMEPEEIPKVDEEIYQTFLVESIDIMESELKRGGPQYSILESLNLGE